MITLGFRDMLEIQSAVARSNGFTHTADAFDDIRKRLLDDHRVFDDSPDNYLTQVVFEYHLELNLSVKGFERTAD